MQSPDNVPPAEDVGALGAALLLVNRLMNSFTEYHAFITVQILAFALATVSVTVGFFLQWKLKSAWSSFDSAMAQLQMKTSAQGDTISPPCRIDGLSSDMRP